MWLCMHAVIFKLFHVSKSSPMSRVLLWFFFNHICQGIFTGREAFSKFHWSNPGDYGYMDALNPIRISWCNHSKTKHIKTISIFHGITRISYIVLVRWRTPFDITFQCRVFVSIHDDVIKWKHFPHYWAFVRGIHRSPVNSLHKGQWRGALVFSLICAWMSKQSWGWWFETPSRSLRRQCNDFPR